MSSGPKKRNDKQRIDNLGIEKSRLLTWWRNGDKTDAATRVILAAIAIAILLLGCLTWRPSMSYRLGAIPDRNLVSKATFQVPNETATEQSRELSQRNAVAFYVNSTESLKKLTGFLRNRLFLVMDAKTFESLDGEAKTAMAEFPAPESAQSASGKPTEDAAQEWPLKRRFELIQAIQEVDPQFLELTKAVENAVDRIKDEGVLATPLHSADEGNQQTIQVYQPATPDDVKYVPVERIRIAAVGKRIETQLREQFRTRYRDKDVKDYAIGAEIISAWMTTKLSEFQTLTYDAERSAAERERIAASVEPVLDTYQVGESILAKAGKPIDESSLSLLKREWETLVAEMTWWEQGIRMLAYLGMMVALYVVCATYMYFAGERRYFEDHIQLCKLLVVVVAVVLAGYWVSGRSWRMELVPLIIGSILCCVVYRRELTLLLMSAICLSLTLFLGENVNELVIMMAAVTSTVLLLGRIRTRTRLVWVGAVSAAITVATVLGIGILTGQTLSVASAPVASSVGEVEAIAIAGPSFFENVFWKLTAEAALGGFAIFTAAAVTTPFLPWVEKAFGVQTDLSLLELGDAADPLLRRLAQRAPGTYNHSINVASIAEAAAEEIGANGLLVRVGAYFHDIGKMFKPEYFIENQSAGVNQHDSLQPAMSTLVIIAHVKDGADLARSHGLPESIIDLILQHHGTTLVEYFYREAAKRSEADPNGEAVSDKDFRYPGPKPQTLEAAVMMLADTVESASRSLVDPTPARIRNLVDSIAEKKTNDGQFDECGLTFKQLSKIRDSLVKSLTAIYHARVKYPGQNKSA